MSGERILIVEDSVTVSRQIDTTLKKMGYVVAAIVDTGKESIKKAYILKPDLILMDITLKEKMTGIEAAREIRNNLRIPVIFLTSLTGDATLEKAVAAEPFGYLLKPLDERALKVTIQMALFKHAMEEKLAESERKCKAIIDHSFEFIGMMKTDGTLIEANRSALKKLGINDSDVLGKPFWDTPGWNHSKELQDRLKEAVLQAASGKFVRFETWYPTVNGSDIYVDFSLKPVRDEQGNVLFLIPEVRDITEHKRAEEAVTIKALQLEMMNEYLTATEQELRATLEDMELGERKLRESEEHLRLLSDNLPNGMIYQVIIEKNGQRRFTYISAGVEQNHGVTAEDVLNDPMVLYNQFSEEDRVRVAEAEDLALKNRTVFDIEVMYRIPSGQLRWVHLRSVSRQLPGGTTIWDGFEIDITKSKQAEEALAITHSRLESAMMSGNLAWWEMDCVTGNVIFNERKAQMLGYPAEQFSHYTDFTSLVHPDDYDAMMQQMRDHLNGIKKQYNVNYRMRSQNGKYLWFHDIGGISEHAVDGSPLKVSGLVMDITERKVAEEQLLLKNNVFESSIAANSIADKHGIITHVNPAFLKLWGHQTQDEAIGNSVSSFFAREKDGTPVLEALDTLGRWEGEFLAKRTDGSTFISQGIATVIRDETEELIGYQSTNLDITERKIAEEALRVSEEKYHNIYRNAALGIFHSTFAGRFIDVNPALVKMLGYNSPEEVVKSITSIADQIYVEPPLRDEVNTTALNAGGTISVENQYRRKDGTRWYGMLHLRIVPEKQGKPRHFEGFVEDITERKKAEDALQKSEMQYRTLVENANEAILVMQDGMVRQPNQMTLEMSGYSEQELRSKSFIEFIHPEDRAMVLKMSIQRLNGEHVLPRYSFRIICKNGTIKWVELGAVLINWEGRLAILSYLTDITERKKAEEALIESEEQSRTISNSLLFGIAIVDAKTHAIIDVNDKALEMIGGDRDMVVGSVCHRFICPAEPGKCPVTDLGQTVNCSDRVLLNLCGERIPIFKSVVRTTLRGKDVLIESFNDITERKTAEEALHESESRYRILTESSPDNIFIINRNDTIAFVNSSAAEHLNLPVDEIIGKPRRNFFCHDIADQQGMNLKAVFETGKPLRNEHKILYGNREFWQDNALVPIKDKGGNVTAVLGIARNITDSKITETYRQLSSDVLGIMNEPAELKEMVSRVLAAIKLATKADAIGIRLKSNYDFPYFVENGFSVDFLLTENTLVAREQNGAICRDSEGNVRLECTCGLVISGKTDPKNPFFTSFGSFWTNNSVPLLDLPSEQDPRFQPRNTCIYKGYASVAIIPIRKGQQEIIGTLQINAVKKDCFTPNIIHSLEQIASHISEALLRKVAEHALRASEITIHNLLNAIPDDLALINSGRLIIAVNESMAATLGQQPEALTGRAIGDFLTSSVLSETIDRIIDHQTDSGQIYFEEKLNDQWLETSVYPVTDRNGADVRIAIQSRDITERKYLEEELNKAGLTQTALNIEKFQILNDQIRNPLQVIRGYASLDPTRYNDKINKQVEIIDNIVTQLDMGWLESEKVQQFLLKHSRHTNQSLPKRQLSGDLR